MRLHSSTRRQRAGKAGKGAPCKGRAEKAPGEAPGRQRRGGMRKSMFNWLSNKPDSKGAVAAAAASGCVKGAAQQEWQRSAATGEVVELLSDDDTGVSSTATMLLEDSLAEVAPPNHSGNESGLGSSTGTASGSEGEFGGEQLSENTDEELFPGERAFPDGRFQEGKIRRALKPLLQGRDLDKVNSLAVVIVCLVGVQSPLNSPALSAFNPLPTHACRWSTMGCFARWSASLARSQSRRRSAAQK